jgi:hypothetical protein
MMDSTPLNLAPQSVPRLLLVPLGQAQFHSKAEPALVTKVRQYLAVLLGIR